MMRALLTSALCIAGTLAADAIFRISILRQLRPVIISPADQAVVAPPVRVSWEGPQRMQVFLSIAGEPQRELGVHESPVEIASEQFPRDGGYGVELRSLRYGNWIRVSRWFQVHATPEVRPEAAPKNRNGENRELLRALEAVRTARDKAQERTKFLHEENNALRDESERLAQQLESLYRTREEEAERAAELERRLAQIAEESRALAEENAAIRQRLSSVIPCTVWGYVTYPHPQTFPPTRRVLMVADPRGQVFRAQPDCELIRRGDPSAASICFCVGNSWGQ